MNVSVPVFIIARIYLFIYLFQTLNFYCFIIGPFQVLV